MTTLRARGVRSPSMIILRNRDSQPVVYEIPVTHHAGVHVKVGAVDRDRDGNHTLRVQHRTVPANITLMAAGTEGDTSSPLPNCVQDAPKIAEAIKARKLDVTTLPDDPPAPAGTTQPDEN